MASIIANGQVQESQVDVYIRAGQMMEVKVK
jgi:hypothetical protein